MYTEQITQRLGITAAANPQILNNASVNSGAVDMSKFHRAFFILEIGTVVAGGSINAQLIQSVSSNLGSSSNVPGSNTGLTALTTSNKQYTFEVRADQLTAGQEFVGLQVTETAGHNVTLCVVGYGDEANHKPGNAQNDSSVAGQQVTT